MTVLALALILGSISAVSAASGKVKLTDIADNANAEAIQVAYDLGIVTGTPEGAYEPDKAVNRAEFAALITRALAIPDSALSSYGTTTFKDTSGYGWAVPYLAILQQRGIMKGDGYGNAMPGRTITPNEAVTMVLRAIGYTDNASVLVGQWPANYVALGQSQNLYANVANDTNMNKASAAQMIYNVLTDQLVQVDANSTVKFLYDTDNQERSLLTENLNCRREPASGRKIVDYDDAAKSKINLLPSVGAYGVLFVSKADEEVVALTDVETTFLTGRFLFNLNSGNVDKFQTVDGTSYSLGSRAQDFANALRPADGVGFVDTPIVSTTSGTGSAIFINGSWFRGLTNRSDDYPTLKNSQSDVYIVYRYGDFYDNQNAKLIVAGKVSGNTLLDLRSVSVWDANPVSTPDVAGAHFLYETGMISGTKFNGHDFPLDVNGEVDHYGYVLNGVDSLDDIAVDNVIYIYKNRDKKISRIDVGTATQSGAITNVNMTEYSRTIGGTTLYTAPWSGSNITDVDTAGNEGTALLDVYYRIYDFQLGEASKGNFAVLLSAANYFDKQIKIFDKTANEVVYGIKGNVDLIPSGNTFTGATDFKAATGTDPGYNTNVGFNHLIAYKLSGGKIDAIPKKGVTINPGDGYVNPSGSILSIEGSPNKLIDSGVVVYVVDANNDYSLGSIKDLLDKDLKSEAEYIEDGGKVKALLVRASDTGAQSVFVMIRSIASGSNTGGTYSVVNGLDFADKATNDVRTWNYINADLPVTAPYDATTAYPTMLKFTLGQDGVLKNYVALEYEQDAHGDYPAAPIKDVGFEKRTGGSNGTFSITYTTTGALGGSDTVAFEANAVLYKIDGRTWKAYSTASSEFDATSRYMFLKTDKDKAYDVIIKL
jgi:hypothetical protein